MTPEQQMVNERIETREREHRGEILSCAKCGESGVVGEGLRARCEVEHPSGIITDSWVHNSCVATG